jgi:hypothetical protein
LLAASEGAGDCPAQDFQAKLLKLGFRSVITPARATDKKSSSGGVGIAWRSHLNITNPQVIHKQRAGGALLHTRDAGDVFLVCVYGDVQGTWKSQATMWGDISRATVRVGKPFLWGGDWNMKHDEANEMLSSLTVPGLIRQLPRATCVTQAGGSVIDLSSIGNWKVCVPPHASTRKATRLLRSRLVCA